MKIKNENQKVKENFLNISQCSPFCLIVQLRLEMWGLSIIDDNQRISENKQIEGLKQKYSSSETAVP